MASDHFFLILVDTSSIGTYTSKGTLKEVLHETMENFLTGIIQTVHVVRIRAEPVCTWEYVILAIPQSTNKPGANEHRLGR